MLCDVALVVPTYNRPEFIHRLLSYHAQSSGLQIIIGDGSDPWNLAENKKIIAAFVDRGLEIVHYTPAVPSFVKPGLEGAYGYAERQVNGVKLSSRRFINTTADDDFVSPEFMTAAADFLNSNPDYSAVTGYVFGFSLDRPGAESWIASADFVPVRSTARSEPRAVDRIGRYEFVPMTKLEYAFFRRETFDAIGKTLLDVANKAQDPADATTPKITTFSLIYLYDLIADHIALALGKVHWLPHLQAGCQFHETNWGGQVRTQYKANLVDSYMAPHWPILANICLDAVSAALVHSEGIDRATARRIAEGGMAIRVGQKLLYQGRLRLEASDADRAELWSTPSDFRRRLRSIPGARRVVQALRKKFAESHPPRLESLPTDVVALMDFLKSYRVSIPQ